MTSGPTRKAPGARDMRRFRELVGKELKYGFNIGYEVKEAFKLYKRRTRQTAPPKRDRLVGYVTEWTGVAFGKDVGSELKRLKNNTGVDADRAWAIFYSMRFFSDPTGFDHDPGIQSSSEAFTEELEKKVIRAAVQNGAKQQRRYCDIDGATPLVHPERLRAKSESVEFKASGRLPARYFQPHFDESYQKGRQEFLDVREELLRSRRTTDALITAVAGPGGYGKTAIAEEVAADDDVRAAFPGGIYWLQHGLRFSADERRVESYISTEEAIVDLLYRQFPDLDLSDRNFSTAPLLFAALPDQRYLIIADDVWITRQCTFLDHLPQHASALISTRSADIAKRAGCRFTVEELSDDASFALLTYGMGDLSEKQYSALRQLRDRFNGWPLLLKLANGHFRWLKDEGGGVDGAIAKYRSFFEESNISGLDKPTLNDDDNADARRELAKLCIETGLNALLGTGAARRLFEALAIFPDDTDIPVDIIDQFWGKIQHKKKPNDRVDTFALLRVTRSYNLIRDFNYKDGSLRLHDEMMSFIRGAHRLSRIRDLHASMASVLKRIASGDNPSPASSYHYALAYLSRHLEKGGKPEKSSKLLLDYDFIAAQLSALDVAGLLGSYRLSSINSDTDLVQRAIERSAHFLRENKNELAFQLYGRLGDYRENPAINSLLTAAELSFTGPLRPRSPHLEPLGANEIVLFGHASDVGKAGFHPDGQRVVTASNDWTARIWSALTGELIGEPIRHSGSVVDASFSKDGRRVFTATKKGAVKFVETKSRASVEDFISGRYNRHCTDADLSDDGKMLVLATIDNDAFLYDAETGEELNALIGHADAVGSVAFSPDSSKVVTASKDGTARIWDAATGTPICKPLDGHSDEVSSALFSPDGRWIVTASLDGTARLWDVTSGEFAGEPFKGHKGAVVRAAFSSDGKRIVTASADWTARIWDAANGRPIGLPLTGHSGRVIDAAFAPDGDRVVTASEDSTARIWDIRDDRTPIAPFEVCNVFTTRVAFSPDGERIATVLANGTVHVWIRYRPASVFWRLDEANKPALDARFSPDGGRLAIAFEDGTVAIWNLATNEQIGAALDGHFETATNVSFSPDGSRLVTASSDGSLRIWDAEIRTPLTDWLEGHDDQICHTAFSPDGRFIVTSSLDWTARIWNASTGAPICKPLERHFGEVYSVDVSSDSRWILTASADRTVRIWDAKNGKRLGKPLRGHSSAVTAAAFSADDRHILTGSHDGTLRIWNTKTRKLGGLLRFDSPVNSVDIHGNICVVAIDHRRFAIVEVADFRRRR